MATPTEEAIDAVLTKCSECMDGSVYPGMSYEDGVRYAIDWMQGEGDHPFEEEE